MKTSKQKAQRGVALEPSASGPELNLPTRRIKRRGAVVRKEAKDSLSASECDVTSRETGPGREPTAGRGDDLLLGAKEDCRNTATLGSPSDLAEFGKNDFCRRGDVAGFSSPDSDNCLCDESRPSAESAADPRSPLLDVLKKSDSASEALEEIREQTDVRFRELDYTESLSGNMWEILRRKSTKPIREPRVRHPRKGSAIALPGTGQLSGGDPPPRTESEIDLGRKLSESYDMQERLVADNADLEVKRHLMYKELMTKDQRLELCRAQIKRLQRELKLVHKENTALQEKLSRNNPQGDATPSDRDSCTPQDIDHCSQRKEVQRVESLNLALEEKHRQLKEIEVDLSDLHGEVSRVRASMEGVKAGSACRGGGGVNSCFEQPAGGPPVPPVTRACGVCPPCPAPCNPDAPPTPAEREVQRLTIQLRQTEENFKTKVTECAMLRAEALRRKEELEKERCQLREAQNKLRQLELRFEGLALGADAALGSREAAFEQEASLRALKQCYREAREEVDELRALMKEQNDQLQEYRVKYLQTQQLVEEQRRQMDTMDMDNTRISEQINLEIQKVKLKFQEKLQELAPIPDLLKAAQLKLKDAQQSQAIAEHNAEQLARELNSAREKVHMLLHSSMKPPEKGPERGGDEKQIALLQQRITQLTESNAASKSEIERLKANVIRTEEAVLANEKRLQEKMHECAQLGGELDRARDEAARALQRANERTDTVRKCMQTSLAELERQLAAARARVSAAEREREEVQGRMQCQIRRLNENFEQAQLRIFGLQAQVQTLRRTASSTGEGDAEQHECACKTFFDDP